MESFRYTFISLVLIMFVISGLTSAQPMDKVRAEKTVRGWLRADSKPLNTAIGNQVKSTDVFYDNDGNPLYYVVYLQPTGFVIVSADDQVEPIIGFVNGTSFDQSLENPLGALVSRDLPTRIIVTRSTKASSKLIEHKEKAKKKWADLQLLADSDMAMSTSSVSDIRVSPLLQSQWDQEMDSCGYYCYNYYTPGYYPCGCVATAMAQLMRFYQYPTTGVGTSPFTIYVTNNRGRTTQETVSLRGGNGSGSAYAWNQMPLVPDSVCPLTSTQYQAIGSLCYDAGVSVSMDYASSGSGAYMHDARTAMVNTFKYSNAVMGGDESDNIGSGLIGMINPNLDAGFPVLLGIYGYAGGHAIIADGYGYNSVTLYHHLNMGWSGEDDAWYNLPNIDSDPPFDIIDSCIYNVYQTGSGEIISGRIIGSSGQPISAATVTATGSGGPYTTATNVQGIFAFTKLPSASSFTISVTAAGYNFANQAVTTGTSSDGQMTSGNEWGVNFASTSPPPAAPASITYPSESNTGSYTVSWSSSSTATSYQLQRSDNSEGTWTQIYSGSAVSYSENIGNGTYYYRVMAINAGGSSSWTTGTNSCVVNIPLPAAPASITYPSESSTGSYTVSWSSSSTATSYQLQRSDNSKVTWTQIYSGSAVSYSENIGDGTYYYRVMATNVGGSSSWTIGTNSCVVNIPPPPIPASITYPSESGTGSYTVSWSVSSTATSYQLQRSDDNEVTWTQIYSGSAVSYSESIGDGTYYYRVMATNTGGSSFWTTGTNSCVVLIPLSAPTSITYPTASKSGQYAVSWSGSIATGPYWSERSRAIAIDPYWLGRSRSITTNSYQLERSSDNGNTWIQIYSGSEFYYWENIGNGSYCYRVRASNAAGSSSWTTGSWNCVVSKHFRY